MTCAFCDIIEGSVPRPARYDHHTGYDYVSFEPLNPVTPGHTLVVPKRHLTDAGHDWYMTGRMFEAACFVAMQYGLRSADRDYNLIVNKGEAAGQTIQHLHVHIVPRTEGDGLLLPWSPVPMDPPSNSAERALAQCDGTFDTGPLEQLIADIKQHRRYSQPAMPGHNGGGVMP